MDEKKDRSLKKRWFYLCVSAIGLLFVGIVYGWSVMKVPLAQAFSWTGPQLSLAYTITLSIFCLGSLLAGVLSRRKVSGTLVLVVAAIMIFAGYFLTTRLSGKSIVSLYFTYGLLIGLGIGLAYNTLITIGNSWFPDKRGVSSGVLMMSFGCSTMVVGKTVSHFFNLGTISWQKIYIATGAIIAIIVLICAAILRKPSEQIEFPKPPRKKQHIEEGFEIRDYSTAEVVRRPAYWLLYFSGTFGSAVGSVVVSFANELSQHLGATAALAATLVGILSVFNGFGRIIAGFSFDKFGRKLTMLMSCSITLLAPILMLVALKLNSLTLGIVSICMVGMSFGSIPSIGFAFISTFYGMKDFPLNYSIGNTKLLLASLGATIAGNLLAITGGYEVPFLLLVGFALISMALNFAIKRP